jgi:succinate dehydrogenase / fumarate reductase, cytochrome b subunit
MFRFYRTTIGKKIVAALTGAILVGFVIGHMVGNLKAFMGIADDGVHKLDHYAHFLREMGEPLLGYSTLLWIVRAGLLVAVVLHVVTVIQLTIINRTSRSSNYQVYQRNSSTVASRAMFWGGLLLLAFIVFHILHLTTGTLHFDGFVEGKVYANVARTFQNWYMLAFYALAMLALSAHLYHGIWSLFQTLGLDDPERNKCIRKLACLCAFIVAIGFISVPTAVFFGILKETTTVALVIK